MELWDVYDVNRIKKQGRVHERGVPMSAGDYRVAVHVCIFDRAGRMLIQRRTPTKSSYPYLWDITAGGSSIAGESSAEAIRRELFEELGIDIDFSDIRPKLTVNFSEGFNDIYTVIRDVDISALKLQTEEVCEARYATREEIHSLLGNGEFVPYRPSVIDYLFEARELYGLHRDSGADM